MIFTPEQWWESEIRHEMYLEEYLVEMWGCLYYYRFLPDTP